MKLLALDLRAYGPFTDTVLDFSGDSSLYLVYGPNEAGKSSALRALTAFLYGIEGQTTDAFLHKYGDLRIGGTLRHSDGTVVSLLRRKGNKNTLLGADGKPVEDTRLEPFLTGVNHELFRTMFGIDHAQLRAGGQEMLKSEGQVGQALFSAGTGLLGLTELSKELEAEAGKIFLTRGRNQELNQLTRKYQELKKARDESMLRGADWKRHQEALALATAQREALMQRRQERTAEKYRQERLLRAMPLVTRRQALLKQLQALASAVLLPSGFTEQRTQAYSLVQSKELSAARLKEEINRLDKDLASLSLRPDLMERAEEILRVHRESGQYLKETSDLPGLRARVSQEEWKARSLTGELRPELPFEQAVEQLRLPRGQRERIRELGNHYQARMERPKTATRARESLELELRRKRDDLAALPPLFEAGALRRVLEQIQRRGNLEDPLSELRRTVLAEERQATVELGRLGLWTGELESLEQLVVPAIETVQSFEAQQARQVAQEELHEKSLREAESRASVDESALEALRKTGEVPTEEELQLARSEREKGWHLVRRAWLENVRDEEEIATYSRGLRLEESYERRVQEADGVSDRLRREAERAERHALLQAAVERHARERTRLKEEGRKLAGQRTALELEWQALWSGAGLVPLQPTEMRAWLGRHQGLVGRAKRLRELRQQVCDLESQVARQRGELERELVALGAPEAEPKVSLETLLLQAQAMVKQVEEAAQRRESLVETIGELERKVLLAQRDADEAEQALVEWQREWGEAVQVLGLSATAHPSLANTALEQVEELTRLLEEVAVFKSRIKGIERNIEHFTQHVSTLCQQVAPTLTDLRADEAASRLHGLWQEASQQTTKRDALLTTKEQRNAEFERTEHDREQAQLQLEILLREAGCERYEALREVEDRSELRRNTEEDLAACEQQLAELSAGRALETFAAEVAALEADGLPGVLQRLDLELRGLEEEQSKLDQQIGTEQNELRRMDGSGRANELAEEAQGLLASMKAQSERYLLLRMASEVLQQQMDDWRKRNQNPLLERAASLFTTLTVGHFTGLDAGYDEQDEQVLHGVRANGEKVRVEAMSDGTRDQLFLALRLASLEQSLTRHEPLPLVVDDILINFDDERSTATLRVLADLARHTQVLFFTHHAHLLSLARENLPNDAFQVLELSTPEKTRNRAV